MLVTTVAWHGIQLERLNVRRMASLARLRQAGMPVSYDMTHWQRSETLGGPIGSRKTSARKWDGRDRPALSDKVGR